MMQFRKNKLALLLISICCTVNAQKINDINDFVHINAEDIKISNLKTGFQWKWTSLPSITSNYAWTTYRYTSTNCSTGRKNTGTIVGTKPLILQANHTYTGSSTNICKFLGNQCNESGPTHSVRICFSGAGGMTTLGNVCFTNVTCNGTSCSTTGGVQTVTTNACL